MNLSTKTLKHLYYEMLRIRMLQLRIDSLYMEGDRPMKTPIHLCIGQEAIPVGVCAHLNKGDYINSNHRGHGHYLAKGGDLKALVAELYCKETGCSKGRGGSMHLVDTEVGHYGSSSIVGGGIPIATGMGLAIKMRNQNQASVVFFGDGAADEGVLYESINFAILKKLPVVFVMENNQYSVCSHVSKRRVGESIFHSTPSDLLYTAKVDGNDVLDVYEKAGTAIWLAKSGLGPSFLECKTYRLWGHAGCRTQDPKGYRKPSEVYDWEDKCPIKEFEERIFPMEIISWDEIENMERQIKAELIEAFYCAQTDPLPHGKALSRYLFCEEG